MQNIKGGDKDNVDFAIFIVVKRKTRTAQIKPAFIAIGKFCSKLCFQMTNEIGVIEAKFQNKNQLPIYKSANEHI